MTNNHNLCRRWRIYACCLFLLSLSLTLSAQDLLVSGQVTDGQLPISGANVLIKNTHTGVVSDFDGRYTITAKPTDSLQVSYLGYTTLTIPIQNRSTINVTLQEDATALGEVQINAGYYTTTDREKTGSIARITAKDIEGQPVNNALEALQGRVPGLEVTQTTGLAGGGYTVRIRGQNSIAAGNEPLYVIDGVPYDVNSLSSPSLAGLVLPGGIINPLNTIDPSAIQSIEVLKDADATAIYGSRGANGVILITTKKGEIGKTTMSFDVSTGINYVDEMTSLLNTAQYVAMRKEAFANDGVTVYPAFAYDINGTWDQNRYTNWQDEFIGNRGLNNTFKSLISGGNEMTRFVVGGSFMKETTVFPKDFNYKKTTFFSNLGHQSPNKKFKLQLTTSYGQDKNYLPTSDLIRVAKFLPPNAPKIYNDEGNLNWENSTWNNPYAALESTYNNETSNLLANSVISYRFFEGLEIKANLGYSKSNLVEKQANPHTMYNPAYGLTSTSSNALKNEGKRSSWIIEPQLDTSHNLGKGKLTFTMGATFQEQNMEQLGLYASGFVNNQQINNFSSAQNLKILNEANSQYRYLALYSRLNYNWQQKYIINLTGRRDGSSRFGEGNRFANFGAIGSAWIFSEENFSKHLKWLSFGKLRASYGTTGNDQIGDYQYLNNYNISNNNYDGQIGLYPSRLYNPHFKWEKNKKIETAIEVQLWDDRIGLEVAYYKNRSDNQLIDIPMPGTTGFSGIKSNLNAIVDNKGWEIGIQSSNYETDVFNWNSSFQLTIPKTELVSFEGLENSTYSSQLVLGQPLSIYRLYQYSGINPETGLYEFVDYNGDGETTAKEDRQLVGDVSPKLYGNLYNSIKYKNWNLDILFQFVRKKGLNEFYNTEPPGFMQNQPTGVLDHWLNPNNPGYLQPYTSGRNFDAYYAHTKFTQSDAIISDASFIRLKTISLSYKLPLKKESTTSCTLFLQGQNLWTLTNFKGGDPEQISGFLPPLKRYSLRVKIEL